VSIKQALATGATHSIVTVLVGPEGDFTPEESAAALAAGAIPVTLGPMILRAETAALYCLSVLGHELF
jgi:16S rRNA (uracil1498-N3)-methyltransferase